MAREVKTRLRQCGKCKSRRIWWYEVTENIQSFEQTDDGIDAEGFHSAGNIIGLHARCRKCGHRWAARGASQVTQLPGHPDYQPAGAWDASESDAVRGQAARGDSHYAR